MRNRALRLTLQQARLHQHRALRLTLQQAHHHQHRALRLTMQQARHHQHRAFRPTLQQARHHLLRPLARLPMSRSLTLTQPPLMHLLRSLQLSALCCLQYRPRFHLPNLLNLPPARTMQPLLSRRSPQQPRAQCQASTTQQQTYQLPQSLRRRVFCHC